MARLVFDVSSLARWAGPPGGIVRVERELLEAARLDRPDIIPAVFDPSREMYRLLQPAWRDLVLGSDGAVVLSDGPALARRGWRAAVPRPGDVFHTLERWRLSTHRPWWASTIDRAERLLALTKRHSVQMTTASGARFAYVPGHLALGDEVTLHAGDTVLTAGYDWIRKSPAAVRRLKSETGTRYVVTCYDMIPVLFPSFYRPDEVAGFQQYWREILPLADAVIAISRRTHDDLAAWARREQRPLPPTAVVPLASSIGDADADLEPALPAGLEAGRYVLLVGTIEPRKGHGMMLDLWRQLLSRGVPQETRMTLVFAGRRGWMTGPLLEQIAAARGARVLHLDEVWDARLERLYADCAFCVLPSTYEGFGLPVVEAFAHGKATIASTGGALPEVAGDLSPCIPLSDRDTWLETLARWLVDPTERRDYEARIRQAFHRRTWREAAAGFWRAATEQRSA